MERGTGSKSLAVAAFVSLIIHGGIFLVYALVFKGAGASNSYEPLQVALVMPAELGKSAVLPLASAREKGAHAVKEDQRNVLVPVNLMEKSKEAPPTVGALSAKAASEAPASQTKDQGAGELAATARAEQNFQFNPEIGASSASGGVVAYLPAAGPSPRRTMEGGINSPGTQNVAGSRNETPLSGYAQLETSRAGALISAAPRYSENSLPAYPLPARRRGYAGVVTLSVEVLADGRVGRLEMKKTSGYDLLDKSAQETVKGWKFSPGKKMGTPVTMWVDVPVRFELN
jgi:TonB family protein